MTVTQSPARPRQRGTVRQLPHRLPTPATEPAYDDETRVDRRSEPLTHGSLALDLSVPERTPAARHLSVVGGRQTGSESEDPFFAPQQTPRVALPDPRSWSGRFVQALVEVLAGDRPVAQLLRWTNDRVYNDVLARVHTLAPAAGASQRPGRDRAMVRSVHVCEPRDGVAEAAIHVRHGGRSRAVAVRLEGLDGRWRCTALQLG